MIGLVYASQATKVGKVDAAQIFEASVEFMALADCRNTSQYAKAATMPLAKKIPASFAGMSVLPTLQNSPDPVVQHSRISAPAERNAITRPIPDQVSAKAISSILCAMRTIKKPTGTVIRKTKAYDLEKNEACSLELY